MSCFNNSQFDRIRARQVDEYTDPPTRRLSAYDREQLEHMGLDESDLPGIVPAFMGGEE